MSATGAQPREYLRGRFREGLPIVRNELRLFSVPITRCASHGRYQGHTGMRKR
jgi:hypothetical protein